MNHFKKSNRAALVLVFDCESNTYLSVFKDCVSFNIPGGKCFENESYEECAIRELEEETGAIVEKEDLKLLLLETDGYYNIATYMVNDYSGKLTTTEEHKLGFVPLEYLLLNHNKNWVKYHEKIYNIMKNKDY